MIKKLIYIALVSAHLGAFANTSDHYPEEFAELFIERPKSVEISVSGAKESALTIVLADYETLRIDEKTKSYIQIKQYLQENNVRTGVIDAILKDLINGVKTDGRCIGRLDDCLLSALVETSSYIFDYDNSNLRIILPVSGLYVYGDDAEYHDAYSTSNAIVNWSRLYGYSNFEQPSNASLSNLTTVGLPLGHINLDTELRSSEQTFTTYTALYDVNFKNTRIQAGRNKYNFSFNTTDFLNSGSNYNFDGAFIGSSRNLVKGSSESQQRIYFYSPQLGQVEVYREDRIILSKVVEEGQDYISYDELPKGSYEVTVVIKVSGTVILSDNRQVINSNAFNLPTGEFDYVFGAGRLNNDNNSLSSGSDDSTDIDLAKGALTYRLFDSFLLGVSTAVNQDEQMYQLGALYAYGNRLGVEFVHNQFSSGDYYQRANLRFSPFFLDMSHFTGVDNTEQGALAEYLHGEDSFTDVSIGLSGALMGGTAFLRGNYYESNTSTNKQSDNSRWSISSGINRVIPFGTLGVNADYATSTRRNDDYRLSLSLTIPITNSGVSTRFNVYANNDGFDKASNYLQIQNNQNDWYAFAEAGGHAYSDRELMGDLSASLSGSTSQFNMNTYAYASDQGDKSVSATLTGTQVLSLNGVSFSNKQSRSFAKVNSNSQNIDKLDYPLTLGISENGKYRARESITLNTPKMLPIPEYKEAEFNFDSSGNNIEFDARKHVYFAQPGMLINVNQKVSLLESQILILDDIDGQPIKYIDCFGEGCVSVEPLSSDGVFRVNYRPGQSFSLISKQGLCVFEALNKENKKAKKGYCLPGVEKNGDKKLGEKINDKEELNLSALNSSTIYLGRFDLDEKYKKLRQLLADNYFKTKVINLGKHEYLFLDNGKITQEQFEFLYKIEAFLIPKGDEMEVLTKAYKRREL